MPGINAPQTDHESPVRIVISPSQSSFFAGEQFSVTITFTNTRTPEAGPSRPPLQANPQTYTHKRGAHSISSAPLARPPTSPGTPRTAVTPLPRGLSGSGDDSLPGRRGLVGTTKKSLQDGHLSELLEQRRKKLLSKSLSVSVSAQELEEQLGEGMVAASAPYSKQTFTKTNPSPTSPHKPSPLARTDTLPLSSNHPHARKQSVLDGQLSLNLLSPTTSVPPQPLSPNPSLSLDTISESSLSAYPSTPSPTTPRVFSPLLPSHSPKVPFPSGSAGLNSVQAYPSTSAAATPRPHHTRRYSQQTQIGLGHPSRGTARNTQSQPRTAFSSTFPQNNTELILYSYAQLIGTVHIIPEGAGGVTPTPDQIYRINRVRKALLRKRAVVGGGSMNITQSLHAGSSAGFGGGSSGGQYPGVQGYGYPTKRPTHGRSASFSSSLLSLLAPAASPSPFSSNQLNGSASSLSVPRLANGSGSGGGGLGLGLGILNSPGIGEGGIGISEESIDPELPLPTFEAQPSMLAVDLLLLPGESRTYTYTIKLPDVLPPTYNGRALRFSYELVVGTCRSDSSSSSNPNAGAMGMSSVSRVMKVPVRVYNHVTVGRLPLPYDVLWPVSHTRFAGLGKGKEKEIPETQGKVVEETGGMVAKLRKTVHLPLPKSGEEGSLAELKQYTGRLLSSLPPVVNGNGNGVVKPEEQSEEGGEVGVEGSSSSSVSLPISEDNSVRRSVGLRMSLDDAREQEEEDRAIVGCREAVEILTRTPKKASYDVTKDGVKVAVLTFTKSAYRLGETVSGVVELNDRTGRARVLQLSAILEAHETLPTMVAPPTSARNLKRAFAEHYSSFTLNTLRMAFALDIPSDASPAFQVRINDVGESSGSLVSPLACIGGLEWKVRLCLLVAVSAGSSDRGTEDVYFKSLERDGPRGEWGSSWRGLKRLAPLEKPRVALEVMKDEEGPKTKSWTQFFVDSMWGAVGAGGGDGERNHHDGDESDAESRVGDERGYDGIKPDLAGGVGKGVDFGGSDEGWGEVRVETVECEVPIKVWPGNTAFRAVDVVFDV